MSKAMPLAIAVACASVFASACATSPSVPTASASQPFIIEQDLVGASVARGEIRTITGTRRGFTAYLNGTWDGQTLTLVEDFEYDDGVRERKTWRLERVAPGRYVGAREDVVGEAIGYQDGAVFRLEYDLRLPSGRVVRFRDVMARADNGDTLNNASIGWLGFRVGSVSLTIQRTEAAAN
jgi:opacity protein-like surface antigen